MMKRILIFAVAAALISEPAYSQRMSRGGGHRRAPQNTQEQKKDTKALDAAYKAALEKIPDAKQKSDPWQTVRGSPGAK